MLRASLLLSVALGACNCGSQAGDGVPAPSIPPRPSESTLSDREPTALIAVPALRAVRLVSAGLMSTCAVLDDGTVWCWGEQLGVQRVEHVRNPRPTQVRGLSGVTDVDIAMTHACAVGANGRVWCWGSNEHGQLGDGTTNAHGEPVAVVDVSNAVEVSLSTFSTCARLSDGAVRCWGSHQVGELGLGSTEADQETCETRLTGTPQEQPCRRRPTPVPGLTGVAQLTSGSSHVCALLTDGSARCWGHNEYGQLGDGTLGFENNRAAPVAVAGLHDAAGLAAGAYHTCAWLRDGTARCWGERRQGQHRAPAAEPSPRPVAVSGLSGVTALAAGDAFTCALLRDGSVDCWGDTRSLAGPDGCPPGAASPVLSCRPAPAPAPAQHGVVQLDVGRRHDCARTRDGTVQCWGDNYAGERGDATTGAAGSSI